MIKKYIKLNRINLIHILVVAVIYIVNNNVLKKYTDCVFVNNYLNDMICPIATISGFNIMISKANVSIEKLGEILLLIFLCGIFWEYCSWKQDAVADRMDIIVYEIGAVLYYALIKIEHRLKL